MTSMDAIRITDDLARMFGTTEAKIDQALETENDERVVALLKMLFGPTGATMVLPAGDHHMDVVCRNGMTKKETILTVPYDTGKKIERWINEGKPGLIQDVFPELTVEQREQMLSGVTPEEWNEMFGNEDE